MHLKDPNHNWQIYYSINDQIMAAVLRRWYIAQREAHSPDCYISNFRVTSTEHDTLQFCMDWTVVDSSVAVCIEVGFWCVKQHHAWSEHLRRVSTADIEANITKKEEQEEIVKEIQVCRSKICFATIC